MTSMNLNKQPQTTKFITMVFVWILCGGFFFSFGQNVKKSRCLEQVYIGGKVGFIDQSGNFVIPPKFDLAGNFDGDDLAGAAVNHKWGLINPKGEWIIEPRYQAIRSSPGKVILAKEDDKFKLISHSGKILASFEDAGDFAEGLAPVKIGGKWGFVDTSGSFIINPTFRFAYSFSDGLSFVGDDKADFYIDKSGRKVFTLEEDTVGGMFYDGLARIKINDLYGFMDKKGKIVIKPQYVDVGFGFQEGLVEVYIYGWWGFIDKTGKLVVDAKFNEVENFTEGLARVKIGEKNGFVDKTGKLVIPMKFNAAGTFRCGVAVVDIGSSWTLINPKGTYLFEPKPLK